MKKFSFIDCENEDFVRYETDSFQCGSGEIVYVQAEDHGHAQSIMFEDGLCERTDWTNTGVKTWCWEDME
jgi:hypothetical protein